jgi:hypothetical protein
MTFKIGDRVKVIAKVERDHIWDKYGMDKFIGETLTVVDDRDSEFFDSVRLETTKHPLGEDDNWNYWFPNESLELVVDKVAKPAITKIEIEGLLRKHIRPYHVSSYNDGKVVSSTTVNGIEAAAVELEKLFA